LMRSKSHAPVTARKWWLKFHQYLVEYPP
jgi:hypothetical protein